MTLCSGGAIVVEVAVLRVDALCSQGRSVLR